jgi:hypothetical protein
MPAKRCQATPAPHHADSAHRRSRGTPERFTNRAETHLACLAAGPVMNRSYRRAWLLLDAMNRTFHAPVAQGLAAYRQVAQS